MTKSHNRQEEMWQVFQAAAAAAADAEQLDRAERLYRAALREAEGLGPGSSHLETTIESILDLYEHMNAIRTTPEAETLCARLLSVQEREFGAQSPKLEPTLDRLARIYVARRKVAEAEQTYRRLLQIEESAVGPDHPDVAATLADLAALIGGTDRYAERESLWRRALRITEKSEGPNAPWLVWIQAELARVYTAQGRYAEAVEVLERAIDLRERQEAEGASPSLADLLSQLGDLQVLRGSPEHAETPYRRALELDEQAAAQKRGELETSPFGAYTRLLQLQDIDEGRASALRRYVGVLRALGRDREAADGDRRLASLQTNIAERDSLLQRVNRIAQGDTASQTP